MISNQRELGCPLHHKLGQEINSSFGFIGIGETTAEPGSPGAGNSYKVLPGVIDSFKVFTFKIYNLAMFVISVI